MADSATKSRRGFASMEFENRGSIPGQAEPTGDALKTRPDAEQEGEPCLVCGEPVEHPDCLVCAACCEAELEAGGKDSL